MKIEIVKKKENMAFKRTEIYFVIDHVGEVTPSKKAVVDEIAKIAKVKRDTVVLNSIETVYGTGKSNGYAKIYATKEEAQTVEPDYILKRNGMQKPEYVAPKAPSE
ncbi:MAG: 30S ribosomal protein S24e [archaeon]|nr:30S ribosomal protein S24e [archaeon]